MRFLNSRPHLIPAGIAAVILLLALCVLPSVAVGRLRRGGVRGLVVFSVEPRVGNVAVRHCRSYALMAERREI